MRTLAAIILALTVAAGCGSARVGGANSVEVTSTAQPAAAEVVLTCDGTGNQLSDTSVAAQPDGIHVQVENTSGSRLSLTVQNGGTDAPPGTSHQVFEIPPGTTRIGCMTDADWNEDPPDMSGLVPLTVADPDGVYAALSWTCNERSSGISDYAGTARGVPRSDLEQEARRVLSDVMQDSDTLERAGYPDSIGPSYQLMRDGHTIARVQFESDLHGGWLPEQVDKCV
jgi:hypothetical protein